MNKLFGFLLLIIVLLLVKTPQSATIIITPSDLNTIQTNSQKDNSTSSNVNNTFLVQIIKDYFGCAQFVNGSCIRCENNYILNSQKKCARISDNCRIFNIDQGICTQCLKNSYLIDGICYPNNQTNPLKSHCTVWSDKECLKCQKTYYLQKGICKPVDSEFQCRIWSDKGVCQQCNNGYNLLNNKCTQSSKYLKCLDNQYLSQNTKCQLAPANCQTWDSFNGKCVRCFTEFDLIEFKCVCSSKGFCVNQNCERYNLDNKKQCDQCKQGYILDKNQCIEKILPTQCQKWNQNKTLCAQCNQKFFLVNISGQCIHEIPNCSKYEPAGNCIQCVDKYELNDNKCSLIIVITNCEKYNPLNKKQCLACKKGYALNDNQCQPKPLPINCLRWNEDFTECSLCKQNFILTNLSSQCIEQIQNCQTYDRLGQCALCKEKYEIINKRCELIVTISNCLKYLVLIKKQCSECQKGYFLQNSQCKQISLPNGCLTWNTNKTACGQCKQNFILTSKGECYPQIENCKTYNQTGNCNICLDQYQLNEKKCEFIVVIPNCQKYDSANRKLCSKCVQGFVALNGQCKQIPLPNNCLRWNDNKTSCAQCKSKFILSLTSGQCAQEVINCQRYAPSGECIACIENFQMTENICHLKANTMNSSEFYGCDTWNFTSSKCNNCHQTFDLSKQGYCFYNDDHCLQRNERSYCTKCQDGYIVNAGNCQIKSDTQIQNKTGCKVFDWVNNNCLVCQDQYVKIDNKPCDKPIDNCNVQGTNGCSQCLANYDLKDGKCISFSLSKCIQRDSQNQCKKCENSFALIAGQCKTFKQLGTILLDYTQFSPQKLKDKIVIFSDKAQA